MKGSRASGTCLANSQTKLMTETYLSASYTKHAVQNALTQVLHILIREQQHSSLSNLGAWLHTSAISLEHDNTIRGDGRGEGQAISHLRPSGIVVESNVGEAVTEDREQEGKVAAKPGAVHESY